MNKSRLLQVVIALAALACLAIGVIGARAASAQSTVFGGLWRVFIGDEEQTGVAELELPAGSTCTSGRCTVAGGSGGGHVIQDETVDLEQTGILRYSGSGVTVSTIDAGATVDGGSATQVSIPGGYQTVGVVDAGSYSQRGAFYGVPGGGITIAGADNAGANTTYLTISQLGVTTSFECTLQTTNGTATLCGNVAMATSGANYLVFARCVGLQSDASNGAGYLFTMSARNSAGTVTANGGVTALSTHESNAGWGATFGAPSGTNVPLNVTGAAGATVNWRCYAEVTQQ